MEILQKCAGELPEAKPHISQSSSPTNSLRTRFSKAIDIAKELFPGHIEIEDCHDPEDPELRYVVVTVRATGDFEAITTRQCEWHDRIEQLGDAAMRDLRLSIYPS